MRGDLVALLAGGGDFAAAAETCLGDTRTRAWLLDSGNPPAGQGWWYLVRGVNCGGPGTYDVSVASLYASRDAGVAGSGNDCP